MGILAGKVANVDEAHGRISGAHADMLVGGAFGHGLLLLAGLLQLDIRHPTYAVSVLPDSTDFSTESR